MCMSTKKQCRFRKYLVILNKAIEGFTSINIHRFLIYETPVLSVMEKKDLSSTLWNCSSFLKTWKNNF